MLHNNYTSGGNITMKKYCYFQIIEHLLEQGLIAEEEHKSLLEKEPCSVS